MSSAIQRMGRIANAQESSFQGAKRSNKAVQSSNEVDLLMLRNRIFSLRNVQIWAVPT